MHGRAVRGECRGEKMRLREKAAFVLGGIGIFILDLGFNGSSASDLFFPPQLRKALPPVLKNISLPAPPALNASIPVTPAAPAGVGGYLPPGQNIYLYFIGGAFLGVAMLILILTNRKSEQDSYQNPTK
jgi:hypothetical protein